METLVIMIIVAFAAGWLALKVRGATSPRFEPSCDSRRGGCAGCAASASCAQGPSIDGTSTAEREHANE